MKEITIKRGDTFGFSLTLSAADVVLEGKASNFKCQIRDCNKALISEVAITESDTPGIYLFRAGDTSSWVKSKFYMDIQYIEDGITVSTETVMITIVNEVTI